MPRENKYLKLKELMEYARQNGAELRYSLPGIFTLLNPQNHDLWVWVMNPYTNEQVKRIRELDKVTWIRALNNAIERLQNTSEAARTLKSVKNFRF